MLVQHFQEIAEESNSEREQDIKDLIKHIPKLVSREDNFNLDRPVTEEEINEVLKDMKNNKAPGPNGFNVDFFKACWKIVKKDILNVVEDSCDAGKCSIYGQRQPLQPQSGSSHKQGQTNNRFP